MNDQGEWFTQPYLESDGKTVTGIIPAWFKATPEYQDWMTYSSQIKNYSLTKDNLDYFSDILGSLGRQGEQRMMLYKDTSSRIGLTDRKEQEKLFSDLQAIATEGNGGDKAKLNILEEAGENASVADIASIYKNMNKEQLSAQLLGYQNILEGKQEADQKTKREAYTLTQLLNAVDDNPSGYGQNDEFKELLQASAPQKFASFLSSTAATMSEMLPIEADITRGILGLAGGIGQGLGGMIQGKDFAEGFSQGWKEAHSLGTEEQLNLPSTGAMLEGREASIANGNAVGIGLGVVATIAEAISAGGAIDAMVAGSAPGSTLAKIGTFSNTVAGAMVYDWVAHDVPIDLKIFFGRLSQGVEVDKALINTEETQPLFGFFGPEAPSGLLTDLGGDALINLSIPVVGVAAGQLWNTLDQATGGAVGRIREAAALKNMDIQNKITDMPVIGTSIKKFNDAILGESQNSLLRQARKDAVLEGSLQPYYLAQNLLTLGNHYGAEVVAPLYKNLRQELDIDGQIKNFAKNANQYGGFGKTSVTRIDAKLGKAVKTSETVIDDLPAQVKQGMLDIHRLSELKGMDDGLIFDAKRVDEIAALEQRVEKIPAEIKKFAEDFSNLNKRVEQMRVYLGLSDQQWVDALQADLRWENYMTRQIVVPGGSRGVGTTDPSKNKLLSGTRNGFYDPSITVTPTLALDMKVHALGTAYAWNERAKFVANSALANNKVLAGSPELGKKLQEQQELVNRARKYNEKVGYDTSKKSLLSSMNEASDTIARANGRINSLSNITARSVYIQDTPPEIRGLRSDFETGKISLAEGLGISSDDAARIVGTSWKRENDFAGITSDGVPYSFEVKDGKITRMTELTSEPAYSEAVSKASSDRHSLDIVSAEKIGNRNSAGVVVAAKYYNENMPILPTGSSVAQKARRGANGYQPGLADEAWGWRVEDGRIVSDKFPVYLCNDHLKGREDELLEAMRRSVAKGFHPKNSATLDSTAVHEMGHSYTSQLALLELNKDIDLGRAKVSSDPREIARMMQTKRDYIEERMIINAMEKLGYDVSGIRPGELWPKKFEMAVRKEANTISGYAGMPIKNRGVIRKYTSGNTYHAEIFSESMSDYHANGASASRFGLAITDEMQKMGRSYAVAISPAKAMEENGLTIPKGLMKEGNYNYPNLKTDKQKAEWLDKWRKKNPYVNKTFNEENYRLANIWDTYFQKEIRGLDFNSSSTAPEKLIKKSGEFMEQYRAKVVAETVADLRMTTDGLAPELATIILGSHREDMFQSLQNYIINKVEGAAEDIAKNLEGGATLENLNAAKVTLWSDNELRKSTNSMVLSLVPEGGDNVSSLVNELFETQRNGLAAFELLPVENRNAFALQQQYIKQLKKENKKAIYLGNKLDKGMDIGGDATHIIHYKDGGQDVYVAVNDPIMASVLQKPYAFRDYGIMANSAIEISNFLSRTYRLGTTGVNPLALMRNLLRDPIQATVTAGFNPLTATLNPETFYKTLRQYGLDDVTIDEVSSRIRSWARSGTMTQEMRITDERRYRNQMERVATSGNSFLKRIEVAEKPLEMWEGFSRNTIGQQSFIKNYRRTGDVDKAMAAALFDTSNATTNFSHAITKWRWATSTVPYLSAAVNGTVSFWRLFNVDPIGMITRITAGFMVPVMAITAWNLSSEENRGIYETLPEWYKQGHLVLVDPNSGKVFALPLPEEIQQFSGTARKLIEFSQEASPYSVGTILTQGAFGFLPVETDGFWDDNGDFQLGRGFGQLASGLLPQVATTIYEWAAKEDLFTGESLEGYNWLNTTVNTLSNIFGTGIKQAVNSIGFLLGVPANEIIGKSFGETLARDLFGIGLDAAKQQFNEIVGRPSSYDGNVEKKATGLFAENERLALEIQNINKEIAGATDEEKEELEKKKQEKIDAFTNKVATAMGKYQQLFQVTGGLEDWQKSLLVKLLTLGGAWASGSTDSYSQASASEAYNNERGLALQRYVQAGLPSSLSEQGLLSGENSIELQAAINRFYGSTKQATTDFTNAVKESGLKNVRSQFYDAITKIYDYAEENNVAPDYDLIEKIQARYLQMVDAALIPIVNQYGVGILNNNDFIDEVRRYVNGMIPSDDWRQSTKNAKRFLSTKEFPTATVDVKKWLKQRYTSGMRTRNLSSDPEVTERLRSIRDDIDNGRRGAAKGKIEDLRSGIQRANFYISDSDFRALSELYNMVK